MRSYDFREGQYFINNIKLENVTFYKDLGIIFENNLLFNKHIDYICKKSYFSLNSIFRCITIKSHKALYHVIYMHIIFSADQF